MRSALRALLEQSVPAGKLRSYMNYKICEDGLKWTHTGPETGFGLLSGMAIISPVRYGGWNFLTFSVRKTLCLDYISISAQNINFQWCCVNSCKASWTIFEILNHWTYSKSLAILTKTADAMNLPVGEKLRSYMNYKICEDGLRWTHTGPETGFGLLSGMAFISPVRYGG